MWVLLAEHRLSGKPQTETGRPPGLLRSAGVAGGPRARAGAAAVDGRRPPTRTRFDAARGTRTTGARKAGDNSRSKAAAVTVSSPFYARALRIAAEPCGALVVREGAKALQLRASADHCGAGATGLEPATSGVTDRRSGWQKIRSGIHRRPSRREAN